MTLEQKYYEINRRLIAALAGKNIKAKFLKFGIDPATINAQVNGKPSNSYPYFQSGYRVQKRAPWTTENSGVITLFEYQLNFYTSPRTEFQRDSRYFYEFNVATNLMSDVRLGLLNGVATILSVSGPFEFSVKSGQMVPSATMLYSMRAVCSYEADIPKPADSTNPVDAVGDSIVGA